MEPLSLCQSDLTPSGHDGGSVGGDGGPERLSAPHLHLSEAIIGHLVHEAVEQSGGASFVHPELPLGGEVVTLLETKQTETLSYADLIHLT